MSAYTSMRARIAAATLDHTDKLNCCQLRVAAVVGMLANRIEICRAWCFTVVMIRSDSAPRASAASGTRSKLRSGIADGAVGCAQFLIISDGSELS